MKATIRLSSTLDERRGQPADVIARELVGGLEGARYAMRGHGVDGNVGIRTELVHASAAVPM